MTGEKAKIFLADERGLNEPDWFRSYNTFNFGKYFREHKKAFGDLYVLNDDTLAGGKTLQMMVEEDTEILLIPVVGAVEYKDSNGNTNFIEAGQAQISFEGKGSVIEITNPYKSELVNFLQVWIKSGEKNTTGSPQIFSFDLYNNKNSLISLNYGHARCKIGKYKGREEDISKICEQKKGFFVFVIEGVFEVKGRLLHARDGLAIWNTDEIDFEALSNDAIILLLEIPGL